MAAKCGGRCEWVNWEIAEVKVANTASSPAGNKPTKKPEDQLKAGAEQFFGRDEKVTDCGDPDCRCSPPLFSEFKPVAVDDKGKPIAQKREAKVKWREPQNTNPPSNIDFTVTGTVSVIKRRAFTECYPDKIEFEFKTSLFTPEFDLTLTLATPRDEPLPAALVRCIAEALEHDEFG